MRPKWCSCKHNEAALCAVGGPFEQSGCFCACHKAESRDAGEIWVLLREALPMMTVICDRAECPQGAVWFSITNGAQQQVELEYEPGEGFGLELKGWGEDDHRFYQLDAVIKRILYLAEGYI